MANQFKDEFRDLWQNINQEVSNLNLNSYQLNWDNLDLNSILNNLKSQFGINRNWWNNLNEPWKEVFRQALEMKKDEQPEDHHFKKILQLQQLDCSEKQIVTLEPVKNLKFLQELDISSTNVVNLTPLKNLPNLLKLYLINTHVSDLKPISKLKNLRVLHFSMTHVDSLKPLKNLVNLQEINFSETYVKRLAPIFKLKKLKMISCKETPLRMRSIKSFQRRFPQASIFYTEPAKKRRWWLF